jgi:hypothetical protein
MCRCRMCRIRGVALAEAEVSRKMRAQRRRGGDRTEVSEEPPLLRQAPRCGAKTRSGRASDALFQNLILLAQHPLDVFVVIGPLLLLVAQLTGERVDLFLRVRLKGAQIACRLRLDVFQPLQEARLQLGKALVVIPHLVAEQQIADLVYARPPPRGRHRRDPLQPSLFGRMLNWIYRPSWYSSLHIMADIIKGSSRNRVGDFWAGSLRKLCIAWVFCITAGLGIWHP